MPWTSERPACTPGEGRPFATPRQQGRNAKTPAGDVDEGPGKKKAQADEPRPSRWLPLLDGMRTLETDPEVIALREWMLEFDVLRPLLAGQSGRSDGESVLT